MEGRSDKHSALRLDILRHLYYKGALSINELSRLTGKSLPLITAVVNSLKIESFVINNQLAPSTGGRRALEYCLNKAAHKYIVAISIDQVVSCIALFDLHNEIIIGPSEQKINLCNSKESLSQLIAFLKAYIDGLAVAQEHILGIGMAMPGFVNAEQGINRTYYGLGENSISDYISERIGLPVYVDNDSSAIALAELNFGAARGMKDVMVVNVGWGIGLGMIVNGKLFRGHNGFAGEFSHVPLADSNNLCACGKKGCLEVDSSLLVLTRKAQEEMDRGVASKMTQMFTESGVLTGEVILKAANAGDQLAINLLSKAAFLIGKGIATLIHIMNPQGVVISGRGAIASKILLAPVQQAINEFCIPMLAEQCITIPSQLNKDAELLGAATLVMERIEKF
ncbi:ROK family protein [Olivibacter sp. SDN3]|uniref:ROK family protein n=1 Tax=Olivibacter sp. SDN3 TaxID=2764720 RepID=UPI0016511298|nr:ROK family protein [Olivibacter sp. SDN3]QNL48412.1 ROK family protein [Olivibacter sp. SDN3]